MPKEKRANQVMFSHGSGPRHGAITSNGVFGDKLQQCDDDSSTTGLCLCEFRKGTCKRERAQQLYKSERGQQVVPSLTFRTRGLGSGEREREMCCLSTLVSGLRRLATCSHESRSNRTTYHLEV